MTKFDIHSAYHHVLLQESQTGMLGFSWTIEGEVRFFKFLDLSIGLRSAQYCFTKLSRSLV